MISSAWPCYACTARLLCFDPACLWTSLASTPLDGKAVAAAALTDWWSWSGSNRRPPECKSGALPAELQPLPSRPVGRRPGSCPGRSRLLKTGVENRETAPGVERLSPAWRGTPPTFSLRKEVIQPQVLLRLPCYDFTPITSHTLGRCLPCGSARGLLVQPAFVM